MSVTGGDIKKAKELIEELLKKLKSSSKVEVSANTDGLKIDLTGKDSALLIGYHGETMADLAYLAGLLIKKKISKEERIRLDVNGYLEAKDKKIKEITMRTVEKVKRSGFPESITGLNAYERRVAHTVAAKEGLISESVGFGKERKIIIKPNLVDSSE